MLLSRDERRLLGGLSDARVWLVSLVPQTNHTGQTKRPDRPEETDPRHVREQLLAACGLPRSPVLLLHSMRRQYLDGTGYALACQENFGCRPLTHSLKKRKDETVRRLVPIRLIPNQGGGEMEDLSPPDHNGPPS